MFRSSRALGLGVGKATRNSPGIGAGSSAARSRSGARIPRLCLGSRFLPWQEQQRPPRLERLTPERAATQLPVEVTSEALEPYAERLSAAHLSFTKQHAPTFRVCDVLRTLARRAPPRCRINADEGAAPNNFVPNQFNAALSRRA